MSDFQWRFGFYDRWSGSQIGTVVEPKDPQLTFNLNGVDSGQVTLFSDDPILTKIAPLGTVVKVWRQAPGWTRDLGIPDLCGILGPVSAAGSSSTATLTFFSPSWMLAARFLYGDGPGVATPFADQTFNQIGAAMLAYTNARGPTHITWDAAYGGSVFTERAYPKGQQIWSAFTDLTQLEMDLWPLYHHADGDTDLVRYVFTTVRGVYRPNARVDYKTGVQNCDDGSIDFTPEIGRFATFVHGEGDGGVPEYGEFAVPQLDTIGLFERNESYSGVQTFALVQALVQDTLAQSKLLPGNFQPTLSAVNPPIYGRDFEVGDLLPCAGIWGNISFDGNLRCQQATLKRTDGGAEIVTLQLAPDYAEAVAVPP